MTDVPIEVRVTVGAEVREITLVGDPADAMLAYQIGRAVSVGILEIGAA